MKTETSANGPLLVSVIVPTYGRPDRLEAAVSSLLKQSYPSVEIVVVDDNPPESLERQLTRKIISRLDPKGSITYIENMINLGGGGSRNAGVAASSGYLITFLDDDDEYLPGKISEQVRDISLSESDVALCAMRVIRNGRPSSVPDNFPRFGNIGEFILRGSVFTPMIMLKREAFEAVSGFEDTPKFQDHILMMKIIAKNFKVTSNPQRLFIHQAHDGPRVTNSPKIALGYDFKHKFEESYFSLLSELEQKSVIFRRNLYTDFFDRSDESKLLRAFAFFRQALMARSLYDVEFLARLLLNRFKLIVAR